LAVARFDVVRPLPGELGRNPLVVVPTISTRIIPAPFDQVDNVAVVVRRGIGVVVYGSSYRW
jgi:hypothetical protein